MDGKETEWEKITLVFNMEKEGRRGKRKSLKFSKENIECKCNIDIDHKIITNIYFAVI